MSNNDIGLIKKHRLEWERRMRQFSDCGDRRAVAECKGAVEALESLLSDVEKIAHATEILRGA